jgi:8-oxo-dGTP pyrophosphatase MutT (NUDIX family)
MTSYIKLLKEAVIPKKWRPRVELYIMKDGKILVGTHPEIGIHVPGGGIEPGQNLITASKNEALEEAGVKIKNIKLATRENYYEDWYKLEEEGQPITKKDKARMKYFRGIKHHYIKADFDGFDDSRLGADNDALKRVKFITKQELIKAYENQGKKFDPPQYAFRIKVVKSL